MESCRIRCAWFAQLSASFLDEAMTRAKLPDMKQVLESSARPVPPRLCKILCIACSRPDLVQYSAFGARFAIGRKSCGYVTTELLSRGVCGSVSWQSHRSAQQRITQWRQTDGRAALVGTLEARVTGNQAASACLSGLSGRASTAWIPLPRFRLPAIRAQDRPQLTAAPVFAGTSRTARGVAAFSSGFLRTGSASKQAIGSSSGKSSPLAIDGLSRTFGRSLRGRVARSSRVIRRVRGCSSRFRLRSGKVLVTAPNSWLLVNSVMISEVAGGFSSRLKPRVATCAVGRRGSEGGPQRSFTQRRLGLGRIRTRRWRRQARRQGRAAGVSSRNGCRRNGRLARSRSHGPAAEPTVSAAEAGRATP